MSNLVEHIISEDYVNASQIFESRLNDIMESKLIEMKKQIQAESRYSPHTQAQVDQGKVKASDVLTDPRDVKMPPVSARRKVVPDSSKTSKDASAAWHKFAQDYAAKKDLQVARDKKRQDFMKNKSSVIARRRLEKGAEALGYGVGASAKYMGGTAMRALQGLGEENA